MLLSHMPICYFINKHNPSRQLGVTRNSNCCDTQMRHHYTEIYLVDTRVIIVFLSPNLSSHNRLEAKGDGQISHLECRVIVMAKPSLYSFICQSAFTAFLNYMNVLIFFHYALLFLTLSTPEMGIDKHRITFYSFGFYLVLIDICEVH